MGVRKELLDCFYDLADFDERKRHEAVIAVLHQLEEDPSYCMGRLVAGLASSRAAARLGYAGAMSVFLASSGADWPAERLFQLADEKLPLIKADNSGSILGQHLLHLAMVNSGAYSAEFAGIVERELILVEKQRGLSFAASDLLALLANKLKKREFAKGFWPLVKKNAAKPLDTIAPEWFHFVLHIAECHGDTLKNEVSFLSADGKLCFSEGDWAKAINILKKTSDCAINGLVMKLLLLSRMAGNFETVYSKIVEKWCYHGDVHKAIFRSMHVVNKILKQTDFRTKEMIVVFSSDLIRMVRTVRKNTEFRFLRSIAESILLMLDESLHVNEWNESDIATLLSHFDKVDDGNFDEFFGGKFKITEKLLVRFYGHALEVVSEALVAGGWRLRRIANAFPQWPVNIQEDVLKLFMKTENWSEEIHNAFCTCIASSFIMSVRAGRNVTIIYKAVHEKLLKKFVEKSGTQIELPPVNDSTLTTFLLMLALWIITSSNSDERHSYLKDFVETTTVCGKLAEDDGSDNLTILNDLLLSLLSRPHRYHRPVVHFVFASFIPRMKLENILHIFETINIRDEELMQEKGESEGFDENESAEIEEPEQNSASRESADDEDIEEHEESDDSETEEGEEEECEVDKEFKSSLKKALGCAAAHSDSDSEKDSGSSTVSDETMFRLDEGLAAVFRKRMGKSRILSTVLVEQAQQFRAKCFDLLLIAVSHQKAAYRSVDLILPLVECAQQALHRKDGQLTFTKATNLLEIVLKHKKEQLNEKKAVKLLDKLVLATSRTVNPVMRNIIGSVTSFLFSACYDTKENVVSENMRMKVIGLLAQYMADSSGQILNEIATAPFIRYPQALLNELPQIINFAFDENIRAFKRAEALSCAVAFFRKDNIKMENPDERKIWGEVTKSLCTFAHGYFSTFNLEDAKPRFFAFLVRVLTAFASLAEESVKERLKGSLIEVLKRICESSGLWIKGNRIKRFNVTSQDICGRSALASLKQLLNTLERP